MKIAIVNNYVPFIYGGAEFLADSLKDKLIEYGHQAIVVKIPFQWDPPSKILDHMLATRLLKVEYMDKVIGLKFPAYYVNHGNKVLWLLHQFRQAYDLWGTEYQYLPSNSEGQKIRETIINADNRYLNEVKEIYTNSQVVTDRLKKFNNIDSQILFPPLMDAERFYCEEYGDYIFYPSRIGHGKRQHLIIESMKYTKTNVKLIIAGSPDTPGDLLHIQNLVEKYNLKDRVKIMGSFISQQEKADLFAKSLACTYIPYDEDSYGYVTLEAFHSKKPVITCTDSGGTDAVVKDGVTGFMVSPDPLSIAEKMDALYNDRNLAKQLGVQGLENLSAMNISWDNVIRRLTK